eukprot:TRINITY_DN15228_c0_g1_i1.p1 TRINITY_DN15228_c0_g1~~TRINITY_DN15228_c0_g1_i1.p1  ORF type:complete len:336 (-),score=41.70 TRINITY_DN15228_c0_g1_i1:72-1049(-)
MDEKLEGYTLAGTFATFILVTLVVAVRFIRDVNKEIMRIIFVVSTIMQCSLRCSFLILAVLMTQKSMGDFYNNFPAAVFVSIVTFVLLQWFKCTPLNWATPLVIFIVVNSALYVLMFVLFGLEVSLDSANLMLAFTILFCAAWAFLIFGIVWVIVKTYPWNDAAQEWTDNRAPIVGGFILLTFCILFRGGFLIYATLTYENTFNLNTSPVVTTDIPAVLMFIYYIIGELIPMFTLLFLQFKLPSNLIKKPYGELERLIEKMQSQENTAKEDDSDAGLCKICLEKEINTAFLPCRHSALCEECSLSIETCPLCRNTIAQTILIYRG